MMTTRRGQQRVRAFGAGPGCRRWAWTVHPGRWLGRLPLSLVLWLSAIGLGGVGCSGSVVGSVSEVAAAMLVVHCDVDGAVVLVEDRALGRTHGGVARVRIPTGPIRVVVRATGHLDQRIEFDAEAGGLYEVEVNLWPAFEEVDGEPGGPSRFPG